MNAEIRASAHCAKTLSRLSVGYRKMADDLPMHRARYIAEATELRQRAKWHLDWARRMRAAS
jgi:hypothetical protein